MEPSKSDKSPNVSRDASKEEVVDSRAFNQTAAQGPRQRAELDERMRNELIALCQAQEEQRRRIDAATRRRSHGTQPDEEIKTNSVLDQPQELAEKFQADESSLQPGQALKEISRSGEEDAFRSLTTAFDDSVQEVRNSAARALYDWQSHRAASFARALREARPDRRRRIAAALATSGLASEAIANLTGASREKTYDAFSLLFLMAKAGEIQPLLEVIENHPSLETKLLIIKVLALSGHGDVVANFHRIVADDSFPQEVRSALTEAIAQLT
jgi:hypothetical protein